ncbi:MAG: helix-turn-helix domain-containing protein [Kiritimatiellota bacterium]|nr:helix-turn-helix domain-containing protein [Kiritimatiellota bacterium]
MSKDSYGTVPPGAFDHPLLAKLSDMASELTGIRFMVVFPDKDGWNQCCPGGVAARPEFCRLIQSSKEGAKHCKMCHVLMSVAASSAGLTEQRCHAGLSVLVTPVPDAGSDEVISVLSTCAFISPVKKKVWQEARLCGKKLGVDPAQLKKTFEEIPELNTVQVGTARALMAIAGEAVCEIKTRILLQKEVIQSRDHTRVKSVVESAVERRLKDYGTSVFREKGRRQEKTISRKRMPVLIRVVENLVRRQPDIPYSVAEIAAAARVTPNHFSSLFHNYTGQTFSEFLSEKRLAAAKSLLGDLTLNISEVAFRVGYSDAGYFTRRFRQATGASPRVWRENLAVSPRQIGASGNSSIIS